MTKRLSLNRDDVFGKLRVVQENGSKYGKSQWLCMCSCGAQLTVSGTNLVRGIITSCNKCARAKNQHGMVGTKIYRSWYSMLQRCENPHDKSFMRYGGRGISVCSDWHNFRLFYEWATKVGYVDDLTIERIDVNGNYCPENCTFIPFEKQALNTRRNVLYKGEVLTVVCKRRGLNFNSVNMRIRRGWSVERAVETPFNERSK